MTFQISILFTNGRTIRKVMEGWGGGGGGGGGAEEALGEENKKKIRARKMSVKKSMQRKSQRKIFIF